MPSVWNPVNGTLVHSQTGVVPGVRYVNPAILDPVRNYPAFVVVSRFTIHVCQSPALALDCTVPIDLMFVRAVLNVKVAVARVSTFTLVIYLSALCALN